jgi:hypothetical protein
VDADVDTRPADRRREREEGHRRPPPPDGECEHERAGEARGSVAGGKREIEVRADERRRLRLGDVGAPASAEELEPGRRQLGEHDRADDTDER